MDGRLAADRFLEEDRAWIDLATGARVRLRVSDAPSRRAQIEWSAQCEVLAALRHPCVASLLDFGALGSRLFEAYETGAVTVPSAARREEILDHAAQFLQYHGVRLTKSIADYSMRPVEIERLRLCPRPLGVILHRRAALDAICDALDSGGPAGPCALRVSGPQHSGMRTLQVLAARAARARGYVPVCARVVRTRPGLGERLAGRHVCVLVDDDGRRSGALAAFLAALSHTVGRRHVVIHFDHVANAGVSRSIRMDRMGVDVMKGMVFVRGDFAPAQRELTEAARASQGHPGLFLGRLGATSYDSSPRSATMVRETAPSYASEPAPVTPIRRGAAVLLRAPARAGEMARHGRHASAHRVLARACHVLRERGERRYAADCAQALGDLALDRGRPDAAMIHFQHARELVPEGAGCVLATIKTGAAWLQHGRLREAEAVHRGALVAARALHDEELAACAAHGLAGTLYWLGRYDEAVLALEQGRAERPAGEVRARLLSTEAWVHLAEHAIAPAVRAARAALASAAGTGRERTLIDASDALAAALASAGDYESAAVHLSAALDLARRLHLPVATARIRITALRVATIAGEPVAVKSAAARVAACCRHLPRLLRFHAQTAIARARGDDLDDATRRFIGDSGARAIDLDLPRDAADPHTRDLEVLLEIAQKAEDDRAALAAQCAEVAAKLRAATVAVFGADVRGRVIALSGRPWTAQPPVSAQAMASGAVVPPADAVEPCDAAAPVRYGGEIIAALACRWTAGTAVDPHRASAVLRTSALAVAPAVRALLDRDLAPAARHDGSELLGDSPAVRALRQAAQCAAHAPFPVLIEGETGSGKELVATAIHRIGPRRERRLCAINCAALSEDLLEAELFGHARGAFTGAVGDRAGLFEEADGGTLFLDEVGELSARAQAKLLRVLQDGQLRRVGETMARKVDVRVVAATNRRLEDEVAAGRFRADLRFRLDVIRIQVPPLRDHPTDIPLLAAHFWAEAAARVESRATLSPETLAALARYDWPGNVRELQNAVAWIAVHSPRRGRIAPSALPAHIASTAARPPLTFEAARVEFERRFVKVALAAAHGHRGKAAEALGVTRQGLAKMMTRLGIAGE